MTRHPWKGGGRVIRLARRAGARRPPRPRLLAGPAGGCARPRASRALQGSARSGSSACAAATPSAGFGCGRHVVSARARMEAATTSRRLRLRSGCGAEGGGGAGQSFLGCVVRLPIARGYATSRAAASSSNGAAVAAARDASPGCGCSARGVQPLALPSSCGVT